METVEVSASVEYEAPVEKVKANTRGEIGLGTPGKRIKRLHFLSKSSLSLRKWVAFELKNSSSDKEFLEDIKSWRANKNGALNKSRTSANIARAQIEASASKAAKKGRVKVKQSSPVEG